MSHDKHSHPGHVHGEGCGHTAVKHDGHVDYLHDGHLHHPARRDHVDEHRDRRWMHRTRHRAHRRTPVRVTIPITCTGRAAVTRPSPTETTSTTSSMATCTTRTATTATTTEKSSWSEWGRRVRMGADPSPDNGAVTAVNLAASGSPRSPRTPPAAPPVPSVRRCPSTSSGPPPSWNGPATRCSMARPRRPTLTCRHRARGVTDLVSAVDACGCGESSLGRSSAGVERAPAEACP